MKNFFYTKIECDGKKSPQYYFLSQHIRKFLSLFMMLIVFFALLPFITVVILSMDPVENIWQHLFNTVFGIYLKNTLILMCGVGLLTGFFGVSTAWMTVRYRFTGVNFFKYALLLPLAIPAYVIAYVYTDILDYGGVVQTALRQWFDWKSRQDYWFFEIRSLSGAIIMLSFVLYPYVYLLARSAFLNQSSHLDEIAISLGMSPIKRFFKVSLPIARPAISVGIMLVLMETLNDFGTVDYFSINTLNRALWDSWRDQDLGSASQLALTLLGIGILLVTLEKHSRKKQKQYQKTKYYGVVPEKLSLGKGCIAFILCGIPVLFGFFIPVIILLDYSIQYYYLSVEAGVISHALSSLLLSSTATILAAFLGVFVSYAKRLNLGGRTGRIFIEATGFGYCFPGAMLGVGLIIPLATFDNFIDYWIEKEFGIRTGLLFTGTIFTVIYAYVVRFLVISKGAVESHLNYVTPSMDMAAQNLGAGAIKILRSIHIPLIKGGVLTGMVLVFVDCMKELPATLILRPFGLETLSTFVYQYTSDELLKESALAALLIVITGLLPVIFLSKTITLSTNNVIPK